VSVLAHGAVGPADELVLVVPALALLVLAVARLRRRNQQHPPRERSPERGP
jgi:hypothetical protein